MIQNTMNEGNTILEIDIRTRDVEAVDFSAASTASASASASIL